MAMALEQDGRFTYNPLQIIYNGFIDREHHTTVYTSPFQIFNGNPSEFSSYRILMDWNINHPEQKVERFVEQAIQVGLAVYTQQACVLEIVDDFEEDIASNIPE